MKLEPAKYSVNGRGKLSRKLYNQRYLFLMLLPAVILVFVFSYVVLSGWLIAFINYRPGFNILRSPWIGFEQFKVFLTQSQDYSYLLRNTLIMNIGSLITNLFTAFIFAILLNEVRSRLFGKIVQTVTFFPFFVSWVIIYSLVNALFAPSTGAINETLVNWGVLNEGLNLLGDKSYSWGMMILLDAWKTLGYNSVIFLAAIAGVSPDEYEAAEIDGANRFQKIVYVLIPNLMPTVIVLLILNSGWILNSNFEQFFLFTNTTNWETMEVFDMYVYKFGLKLLNYPYATAVGIMKSIVSLLILIAVNAISKKSTGRSII
ncbi:ABC transporter permease [Paenibacillus nasutitermitis]|uniref:Sugar ABC transporter permease n=1 Tax=Paenibacillus nasutitermitis TaxID=1652958 RepID=A0A916YN35_9BACL|nr:ABC transporter permease subunit [Paenibacillus nasutitermitis]GGD53183.1 sugar ABC transporter permease [Paenibacillus nasutitermitis]